MSVQKQYTRPPITEAVIELRFGETLSLRDLDRVQQKFKRQFPTVEEQKRIEFSVEDNKVTHNATPAGYKMTAESAVDVLLVNPNSLCTVRLAPYEGWDVLVGSAADHFALFTRVVGRKNMIRVGTRFINRFDIPNELIKGVDLTEFLLFGIALPLGIGKTIGPYSLAANTVHDQTGVKLLVQSAVVAPALLDHTSITLDTDAFLDSDIPQKLDEMWAAVARLRVAKNAVFESSITEKLRELFK